MRKLSILGIFIAIILVSSLILSACSSASTTTTTSKPVTSTTATSTATSTTSKPPTSSSTTATSTTPSTGKVYELKFSYHTPERASMVGAYFKPWAAAVEQASNGKVKITHYAGESLVKIQDQYDALVSGLSDIAMVELDITPGRFPKTEFYSLPFLSPNPGVTAKAYYEILQKYSVADELKEVKMLTAVTISGNHYAGNKEAKTLADFKGQRMRSGAKLEGYIIEQLGAVPIEISTADLATSLERGLADSLFLTWSGVLSFGVKDVTKYRTHIPGGIFTKSWIICINKKLWDSMPADVQKAFSDNSGADKSKFYSDENDKLEAGSIKAIEGSDKGQGKPPFYTLPASEKAMWQAALMPVWDRWVKEMEGKKLPGRAIIDDLQALIQKYSP